MAEDLLGKATTVASIDDAVALAIEFEDRTRVFYLAALERVENKYLRSLLEFLANEEVVHTSHLKQFADTQASYFMPEDVQNTFKKNVEELMLSVAGEVDASAEQFQVILAAMRIERQAEDIYRMLAEKFSENIEVAGLFLVMAGFERTHYDLLDGLMVQVDDFRMQT